jgi:hypothetical protein
MLTDLDNRPDPALAEGDPFLRQFFERIPAKTAKSFSSDQLLAIKMAFGARSWGVHRIDLRFSIPLLRYYFVLVMGPEKRSGERRSSDKRFHPVATLGNGFVLLVSVALLAVPAAVAAYAVKSGLGINVSESAGVHDTLGELMRNILQIFR